MYFHEFVELRWRVNDLFFEVEQDLGDKAILCESSKEKILEAIILLNNVYRPLVNCLRRIIAPEQQNTEYTALFFGKLREKIDRILLLLQDNYADYEDAPDFHGEISVIYGPPPSFDYENVFVEDAVNSNDFKDDSDSLDEVSIIYGPPPSLADEAENGME